MTKTIHPITPAGARVLMAFSEWPNTFIIFNRGRGADWFGSGSYVIRQTHGKPLASTIRKLVDGGYLEPRDLDNPDIVTISESGKTRAREFITEDLVSIPKSGMNAHEVLDRLRKFKFTDPEWMWVEELEVYEWGTRRLDAFALRLHSGRERDLTKYLTTWAIEVKVDRADFLTELQRPAKRRPAMGLANLYAFATPAGMIHENEVPQGCGLLEVHDRQIRMKVKPPWSPGSPPDWHMVARMVRRLQNGK